MKRIINRYWLIIIIGVFGGSMSSEETPNIWAFFVVLGVILILINIFILDKFKKSKNEKTNYTITAFSTCFFWAKNERKKFKI